MKIKERRLNIKNMNLFLYLLIFIFIAFNKSELKETKRNLISVKSEIRITFRQNGTNQFLSSNFSSLPTSIEGLIQNKCNFTSKTCNIDNRNKSITLNYNNENITSLENMFINLTNIKEIDLSNFDSSKVTNMKYMLYGCENLNNITFGNMNASLVENMEGLFMNCYNLKIIDLSHFNISLVTTMKNMFYQCWNLTSIDLSNFGKSEVSDMSGMFYKNKKLINIDFSNSETSKVTSIIDMFSGCDSLQYLDIRKFKITENTNITGTFPTNNKIFKFCVNNEAKRNKLISSIQDKIICSDTCFVKGNIYLNKINNTCVKNCTSVNLFEYEYICYEVCPKNTIGNIKSKKCMPNKCNNNPNNINLCIKNIPEGYYYNSSNEYYEKCQQNQICKECKSDNKLINNIKGIYQWSENCPLFYYYEKKLNYFKCTDKCPDGHKIILEKMQCIDKCGNDKLYKYEFGK